MKVIDNFDTIHQQQEISYPAGMTLSQWCCLLYHHHVQNVKRGLWEGVEKMLNVIETKE